MSIFEHKELLAFLKAHADERRKKNPGWSYNAWAQKLKLSGAAAITMLLNGQREPGPKLLGRLIEYFRFDSAELEYFWDLVRAHRSRNDPVVHSYFQQQLGRRRTASRGEQVEIPLPVFDAIAHWHFYAIREMTALADFREDAGWIRERLRFEVDEAEVARALERLLALGLIGRDASGKPHPSPKTIDTPKDVQAAAIREFHGEALKLGRMALSKIPANEREFSSVTLNVRRDRYPEIQKRLRDFLDEFCELAEAAPGEEVYQLNLQFFPVTCSRTEARAPEESR